MPVRYSAVPLGLVLVGSLVLLGCGQSAGEGGHGGSGGTDPELASVEMYVFDWSALPLNLTPAAGGSPLPPEVPLEGVEVCQLDADNCVTTDSEGLAEIFFPRDGKEIVFTIVHEGYGRWLVSNVVDETFPELWPLDSPVRFPLYTHEYLEAIAAQVEVSYPWEKGMAALGRWPPQREVKFIPVGPTADEVGAAFYFDDDTIRYSLEAGATGIFSAINDFPLSQGGFAEVTAGVHQFELSVEAGDCTQASWSWPGDAPNRFRIPVLAGYTTYGSMRCGESPF